MRSVRGFFIWLVFYLLAIAGAILLYAFFETNTDWSIYATWLAVVNILTFALYGLDKELAKLFNRRFFKERDFTVRAPEDLFHVLALAGGFIGGWLGMVSFDHKTNWSDHSAFPIFLSLATLGHAPFIYDRILAQYLS